MAISTESPIQSAEKFFSIKFANKKQTIEAITEPKLNYCFETDGVLLKNKCFETKNCNNL